MATINSIDAILKLNYGDVSRLQRARWKDFPALTKFKIKTGPANASGKALVLPVVFNNPQGFGGTLSSAQTAAATSGGNIKPKQWVIPYGTYSASCYFERKALVLSKSDIGAYIDAKKEEIEGIYNQWNSIFSWYLLNTKGRALGSFTMTSGVGTMVNAEDIVNISYGMPMVVSANSGDSPSDILIAGAGVGYVNGVNYSDSTFTVSATDGGATATPANWTGTMYAFRQGDFGGTGSTVICDGFGDYIPATAPSATAFNNVDRTANINALSGYRLPTALVANMSTENRIKTLCNQMAWRGFGAPDFVLLSPQKWQDVADGLESRGIRDAIGKDATFGFETLHVVAGGKRIECIADRFMPTGAIYAASNDALELHVPDGFPAVVNDDGLSMLRQAGANAFEMRWEAYPATFIKAHKCGRCAA